MFKSTFLYHPSTNVDFVQYFGDDLVAQFLVETANDIRIQLQIIDDVYWRKQTRGLAWFGHRMNGSEFVSARYQLTRRNG